MAAMKPRTGDGPLEVSAEGRGIVVRIPTEGGGRGGATRRRVGDQRIGGARVVDDDARQDRGADGGAPTSSKDKGLPHASRPTASGRASRAVT